jgi:hypothetical protein
MNMNWIYALIIVLVLGAAAVFFLTRTPAASVANQTADTRALKTYYDERYKMAFNFPESYDISDREVSATHHAMVLIDKVASSTMPKNSDGAPTITIDIFSKTTSLQADKWVKNSKESNYLAGSALATTTVAEIPAVAYGWDGLYQGTSIVFPHSGKIYMMSVTYNSPNDQIYKDFAGVVASVQLDP